MLECTRDELRLQVRSGALQMEIQVMDRPGTRQEDAGMTASLMPECPLYSWVSLHAESWTRMPGVSIQAKMALSGDACQLIKRCSAHARSAWHKQRGHTRTELASSSCSFRPAEVTLLMAAASGAKP